MRSLLQILACSMLVAGCGTETAEGPPQVKYGHAECAHCGMIVSSERYASAIMLPRGSDNAELIFDDIDCMLGYEHERPLPAGTRRYVHDAQTSQWLTAEQAQFVRNPEVHTPMGSGLQAFAQAPTTPASTYSALLAESKPTSTTEPTSGR